MKEGIARGPPFEKDDFAINFAHASRKFAKAKVKANIDISSKIRKVQISPVNIQGPVLLVWLRQQQQL